jgi:hypothetical protein
MNQLLLVLITALVTAGFSFTGLWIGARLTRGNEDRKWRRDHAIESYFEFIEAVETAQHESDRIYISTEYECGTEDHAKQAAVVLDKMIEMDRLAQHIFLLAPDVVNTHASHLTDHMGKEIVTKSILCPKIEKGERDLAVKQAVRLLVLFRNAARSDLGVHLPRHTREEWEQLLSIKKRWWRFWA